MKKIESGGISPNVQKPMKSYRVYNEKGHEIVSAVSQAAAKRAVNGSVWKVEEMTPESEALRDKYLDKMRAHDALAARGK